MKNAKYIFFLICVILISLFFSWKTLTQEGNSPAAPPANNLSSLEIVTQILNSTSPQLIVNPITDNDYKSYCTKNIFLPPGKTAKVSYTPFSTIKSKRSYSFSDAITLYKDSTPPSKIDDNQGIMTLAYVYYGQLSPGADTYMTFIYEPLIYYAAYLTKLQIHIAKLNSPADIAAVKDILDKYTVTYNDGVSTVTYGFDEAIYNTNVALTLIQNRGLYNKDTFSDFYCNFNTNPASLGIVQLASTELFNTLTKMKYNTVIPYAQLLSGGQSQSAPTKNVVAMKNT
jgi:hypothetical protein